VNARFNSNGDTAFAGALLLGRTRAEIAVCIDQGGNNRCCGDVLIAVRCGGNFCPNKGTGVTGRNVSAARAQPTRGFSPPSTSVERRPMLVLERKEILRRKAVSGFGSVRSPRFRRRPATVRRNTFSGSSARRGDRGPVLRAGRRGPDRAHPACVSCGGSPALLSPGDGRGTLAFYPHREGTGGKRGRTESRAVDPAGVAPRLSGWDIVVVRPRLRSAGNRLGHGFGYYDRFLGTLPRACRGSGSPGQASGFRKCRSTRGTFPSRISDGRRGDPGREGVRVP